MILNADLISVVHAFNFGFALLLSLADELATVAFFISGHVFEISASNVNYC
jgi:hypothetical protein